MRKTVIILSLAAAMLAGATGDPYDYKKTVQRRVSPEAVTTNAAITSAGDTSITANGGAATLNANVTASGKTITVMSAGGNIAQTAGTISAGTLSLVSDNAITQANSARMIPSAGRK